jgi:hypothetical protein
MRSWTDRRRLLAAAALIFALTPIASYGSTYYVSSSKGSDANSGLSEQTPWKTLRRINLASFAPGDVVLLRRGDVWREQLRPRFSGSPGSPIRFSGYGSGPKPTISGSDEIDPGQWARVADALYCLDGVLHQPTRLWHRGTGVVQTEAGGNGWWYEADSRRVCLRNPHPPEGMEVQIRDANIDNNGQSHIVYEDLNLEHALEGLRVFLWSGTAAGIRIENCRIVSEPSVKDAAASAGVYVSARSGTVSQLVIRNNDFRPFPRGLNHWGIYLVQGIEGFAIENNRLSPAGEDAITVWHSAHGVIAGNRGGGNGENTIDVKDSREVAIRGNYLENDREYNIVVHAVDELDETSDILVTGNNCIRGGNGGRLSAGIALLRVRRTTVRDNLVAQAYGAGILVVEPNGPSGNRVESNRFDRIGLGQHLKNVVWEYPAPGRSQP